MRYKGQQKKLQDRSMLKNRYEYLHDTAEYERKRGNELKADNMANEAQIVAAELMERYGVEV